MTPWGRIKLCPEFAFERVAIVRQRACALAPIASPRARPVQLSTTSPLWHTRPRAGMTAWIVSMTIGSKIAANPQRSLQREAGRNATAIPSGMNK